MVTVILITMAVLRTVSVQSWPFQMEFESSFSFLYSYMFSRSNGAFGVAYEVDVRQSAFDEEIVRVAEGNAGTSQ